MSLQTGLAGSVSLRVSADDTATALRSGDVPVLATPRLIALAEEATCAALAGHLEEGTTTVGVRVQVDHVAPTSVDHEVTADAVLSEISGRQLVFTISVSDARGLVAAGRVTRVVVDRQRFLDKAR